MRLFRIAWKVVAIIGWMLYVATICIVAQGRGWRGVRRATYFSNLWGRGMCRIMGVKLEKFGELADTRGRLFISNHSGYLDILSHAALFRLRFASKAEVRNYPVIGWMLGTSRPIWVNRKNKVASEKTLQEIKQSLENRINVMVYPEGTSTDGRGAFLPFKSTSFEAICETNLPIQPIITRALPGEDGRNLAWYGDESLAPHASRVLGYRNGVTVQIYILPCQHAEPGEGRKALAERMQRYMNFAREIIISGDKARLSELLNGHFESTWNEQGQ